MHRQFNIFKTAGLLVGLILLTATVVQGQGLTAVTGRILDPTNAVIPGVEVTVTNAATCVSRTVITNDLGIYAVTQLPAAAIARRSGPHDLCFTFTQAVVDPMWVVDAVQLVGLAGAEGGAHPATVANNR